MFCKNIWKPEKKKLNTEIHIWYRNIPIETYTHATDVLIL